MAEALVLQILRLHFLVYSRPSTFFFGIVASYDKEEGKHILRSVSSYFIDLSLKF